MAEEKLSPEDVAVSILSMVSDNGCTNSQACVAVHIARESLGLEVMAPLKKASQASRTMAERIVAAIKNARVEVGEYQAVFAAINRFLLRILGNIPFSVQWHVFSQLSDDARPMAEG